MRAGLIVSGVLGLGTAATFGAALVVATLFPHGATVASGSQWGPDNRIMMNGGVAGPVFVNGGASSTIGIAVPPPAVFAPTDGSSPAAPDTTPEASPGG